MPVFHKLNSQVFRDVTHPRLLEARDKGSIFLQNVCNYLPATWTYPRRLQFHLYSHVKLKTRTFLNCCNLYDETSNKYNLMIIEFHHLYMWTNYRFLLNWVWYTQPWTLILLNITGHLNLNHHKSCYVSFAPSICWKWHYSYSTEVKIIILEFLFISLYFSDKSDFYDMLQFIHIGW